MNKDIKKQIFRQQVIYCIVLLIFELSYTSLQMLSFINQYQPSLRKSKVYINTITVLNYGSILIGIVYPIVKLSEPQFLSRLGKQYRKCFKCKGDMSKKKEESLEKIDDPNIAFLCSALNNMLVSGIL